LNPFCKPGILVTTAIKHTVQGGYSKLGQYMNILHRNLGQFTDLSLEEALIPRRGRLKI
jgi:hypothetical protein